jgi:DNA repair exonuclease SbcCD ATPase subunit
MSRTERLYRPALKGRKIPILTLDGKWYELFRDTEMTPEIRKKADELNSLLRRQGKINTESKQIKAIKMKLLDEMVPLSAQGQTDDTASKKLEEHKKLIDDCNKRLDSYQDEVMDLPEDITAVNNELMLLTMASCYTSLKDNNSEIENYKTIIRSMRIELKKDVVRKQDKEIMNRELYSYMHDIFGAEVIELFDMKYIPDEIKPSGSV